MPSDADILKARILIVDDQPAHVQMLDRVLREAGYDNVSSTLDPYAVSALHRDNPYDLILLDLQMPGLDGFGVMEALKADAGAGVLPVIALTAQPAHKLRALQAGARDFINKPFDIVEVKLRIHHLLEVRLLYQALDAHRRELEATVLQRTAELRDSEDRYRSLTELAAEWYWEQDAAGAFTRMHGPVMDMLGLREPGSAADAAADTTWDAAERNTLNGYIAARQPFLDFVLHRRLTDGSRQAYRMSGEPVFDSQCRVTGYRGVGVTVLSSPGG